LVRTAAHPSATAAAAGHAAACAAALHRTAGVNAAASHGLTALIAAAALLAPLSSRWIVPGTVTRLAGAAAAPAVTLALLAAARGLPALLRLILIIISRRSTLLIMMAVIPALMVTRRLRVPAGMPVRMAVIGVPVPVRHRRGDIGNGVRLVG
jgi:hypothetical protein